MPSVNTLYLQKRRSKSVRYQLYCSARVSWSHTHSTCISHPKSFVISNLIDYSDAIRCEEVQKEKSSLSWNFCVSRLLAIFAFLFFLTEESVLYRLVLSVCLQGTRKMQNIYPIKITYLVQDIHRLNTSLSRCKNDVTRSKTKSSRELPILV